MILLAWVLAPTSAYSENILDNMELKHGVAFFHDLKYPLGFTHFDYVNPDAPKGGKLVLATQLNFNTLAPQQAYDLFGRSRCRNRMILCQADGCELAKR